MGDIQNGGSPQSAGGGVRMRFPNDDRPPNFPPPQPGPPVGGGVASPTPFGPGAGPLPSPGPIPVGGGPITYQPGPPIGNAPPPPYRPPGGVIGGPGPRMGAEIGGGNDFIDPIRGGSSGIGDPVASKQGPLDPRTGGLFPPVHKPPVDQTQQGSLVGNRRQIIDHYPKGRAIGITNNTNAQRAISAPRIPPMQGGTNEWQGQNAPQGPKQFTPPPSAGLNAGQGFEKRRPPIFR